MSSRRLPRWRGFTLIEMVVAIVIIGVGLAGLLLAFNTAVRASADPLVRKQMLAVAEEMLEEILLKPYAVGGAAPANAATVCGAGPAARTAFDDVADYAGYQTTGVCAIDGSAVAGLENYNVRVAVATGAWQGVANTRRITVTVSHGGETLALDGWRTGYAQ